MKYVVSLTTLKGNALYVLEPIASLQPLGVVRLPRMPPIWTLRIELIELLVTESASVPLAAGV